MQQVIVTNLQTKNAKSTSTGHSNNDKIRKKKDFKMEIRDIFSMIDPEKITIKEFRTLLEEKLQVTLDGEKRKIMNDYLVELMTNNNFF